MYTVITKELFASTAENIGRGKTVTARYFIDDIKDSYDMKIHETYSNLGISF